MREGLPPSPTNRENLVVPKKVKHFKALIWLSPPRGTWKFKVPQGSIKLTLPPSSWRGGFHDIIYVCIYVYMYVCIYKFQDDNKQEILELKLFNIFCYLYLFVPLNEYFCRNFRIYEQNLSRILFRQSSSKLAAIQKSINKILEKQL